jgi:hypothetical protein
VDEPVIHLTTTFLKEGSIRVNRVKFKRFEDGNMFINIKKGHSRATDIKAQMQMVVYEHNAIKLRDWLNEHYPLSQD